MEAGTGDAVTGDKELTGIVLSDPGGVIVQPGITTNETSTRETQTVLMDNVDPDIFLPSVFKSPLFSTRSIMFIYYTLFIHFFRVLKNPGYDTVRNGCVSRDAADCNPVVKKDPGGE